MKKTNRAIKALKTVLDAYEAQTKLVGGPYESYMPNWYKVGRAELLKLEDALDMLDGKALAATKGTPLSDALMAAGCL